MTLFEYMSVAISLIVALTYAEALRGLRIVMHPDRRYWVHSAWLIIKLSNPITFWWVIWGLRDFPDFWNFRTYLLALIIPGIVFMQVISLLSDNPASIGDWREHFYDQRRWFFGLNAAVGGALILWLIVIYSSTSLTVQVVPIIAYASITVLSLAACFIENPRFHATFVSLVGGFIVLYFGVIGYSPDGL